jgi:CO/xanthine dehydrogenase FAD-binding subunit
MSNPKQVIRPTTLDEALGIFTRHPGAYPLAGGALALGVLDFPHEMVIDLKQVPDLSRIEVTSDRLHIGGAVMLETVVTHEAVPVALKRAITRTVPLNVRNNTSVLETLTVDRPPLEWLTALVALDASIVHTRPGSEAKTFSLAESAWVAGEHGAALATGLIHALQIPLMGARDVLGAAHIARTPAGDPIINGVVHIRLDDAGHVAHAFAALAGVSEHSVIEALPLGDVYHHALTAERIQKQAAQVPYVVHPPDDYLGSANYRKQMAEVVIRRALEDAAAQLKANEA